MDTLTSGWSRIWTYDVKLHAISQIWCIKPCSAIHPFIFYVADTTCSYLKLSTSKLYFFRKVNTRFYNLENNISLALAGFLYRHHGMFGIPLFSYTSDTVSANIPVYISEDKKNNKKILNDLLLPELNNSINIKKLKINPKGRAHLNRVVKTPFRGVKRPLYINWFLNKYAIKGLALLMYKYLKDLPNWNKEMSISLLLSRKKYIQSDSGIFTQAMSIASYSNRFNRWGPRAFLNTPILKKNLIDTTYINRLESYNNTQLDSYSLSTSNKHNLILLNYLKNYYTNLYNKNVILAKKLLALNKEIDSNIINSNNLNNLYNNSLTKSNLNNTYSYESLILKYRKNNKYLRNLSRIIKNINPITEGKLSNSTLLKPDNNIQTIINNNFNSLNKKLKLEKQLNSISNITNNIIKNKTNNILPWNTLIENKILNNNNTQGTGLQEALNNKFWWKISTIISGMSLKLAGRLNKQKVIARRSVVKDKIGSFSTDYFNVEKQFMPIRNKNSISYTLTGIDSVSYNSNNRKGSYTISLTRNERAISNNLIPSIYNTIRIS